MVLRLLRGESLDAVSREVGVEVYRLEAWKARALAGLELGLISPQFSWTRIKGESDVTGSRGHGSVETGEGNRVGAAVGLGALVPGQRWSASRKRDVVLRLLRGESLDTVSREVGVEVYRLEWKWQLEKDSPPFCKCLFAAS